MRPNEEDKGKGEKGERDGKEEDQMGKTRKNEEMKTKKGEKGGEEEEVVIVEEESRSGRTEENSNDRT